ncbi:hypothetical protein SD78_1237 [Bacillus badius]|nr:hypothetical protein SD78_1237 [Bacillus badius]
MPTAWHEENYLIPSIDGIFVLTKNATARMAKIVLLIYMLDVRQK